MTIFKGRYRHRVAFQRRTAVESSHSSHPINYSIPENSSSTQSIEQSRGPSFNMSTRTKMSIPDLFKSFPLLQDDLSTDTSQKQDKNILECLPFLSGEKQCLNYNRHGILNLDRKRHISFLHKCLQKLPAKFVAADASRPWIFYWCLNGLVTMGEDVSRYRESLLATIRPIQNITGGFGGGHGQMSHLAPTYAIILSLAIVGGSEVFESIDRKAMWKWLGALKQPDGGFQMAIDGEEDVRGAYCAVVIMALLNLPIELPRDSPLRSREGATLLTGLSEWIGQCQTFEGGISARPDTEAHGAYTFCALACLCILGEPHVSIPRYLNVSSLVSWLSSRQYAPEGGFSGRTNKLVDGCYSHWVGGCWPLVEACLEGLSVSRLNNNSKINDWKLALSAPNLYSREGLIRYILCCCQDQSKRGGLRDKPSHVSDSYHTCYVLAGLSSAQTKWYFNKKSRYEVLDGFLHAPFSWKSEPHVSEDQVYDESDRVNTLHPIFVIPEEAVQDIREYFSQKISF